MPKWNCSNLERLCKNIELTKKGRLIWHGRWAKPIPNSSKAPLTLAYYPHAQFSYDDKTVLSVVRYLFFQLHDDRHLDGFLQAFQHRLKLAYAIPPAREEENQIPILLKMSGDNVQAIKIPKLAPGNLSMSVIPEHAPDYRRIPIEFPQVVGAHRVPLVLHYLNGGTDATAPITTSTKVSANVLKGIVSKGTGSTFMRLRNITPYHPSKELCPEPPLLPVEMVQEILLEYGIMKKWFQGSGKPFLTGIRRSDVKALGFTSREADDILSILVRANFLEPVYKSNSHTPSYNVTNDGIQLLRRLK